MEYSGFQGMINKIEGVINSKVITENEELVEIHVLANNLRSAKQLSRDIESAIAAGFDYKVDRKIISIAQIDTDEERDIKRIRLDGISYNTLECNAECSVKLIYDEKDYAVTKTGIKTASKRKKLIADATLNAIEMILGKESLFDVQDVVEITRGDIRFVNVLVNMMVGENEEFLIGSAIVKNDINEAIAKATLDAVNRRIKKFTN